jgi:hypothetical protein
VLSKAPSFSKPCGAAPETAWRASSEALAVAVEQRDTHGGLKLLDARADVGGHAVQLARSLDDAAFLHDGPEHLQIGEVHCRCSEVILRYYQIENNLSLIIHYSRNNIQPMLVAPEVQITARTTGESG